MSVKDKIISKEEILEIVKQRENSNSKMYTFEEAYSIWKEFISKLWKNEQNKKNIKFNFKNI